MGTVPLVLLVVGTTAIENMVVGVNNNFWMF